MSEMHSNILTTDLNLLVTLNALLETASVSAAADRIGRSQSAVSHALHRLRVDFADELLIRKGRTMRLTPFAEELRPDLARLIELLTKVVDRPTTFDPATSSRPIRIACRDIALPLLSPVLSRLARQAPLMPIQLVDATSAVGAVKCRDADLGVAFGRSKSAQGLAVAELGPLKWTTFGAMDHPFSQSGQVEDWLAARHIVVGSDTQADGPIDQALKERQLARTIAIRVSSFTTALAQVSDMDALFTTLREPFAPLAERLGLNNRAPPLSLPNPNAFIVLPNTPGQFSEFLQDIVAACFDVKSA